MQGESIQHKSETFDLNKYGLSHIKNTESTSWSDSDINKLINAFINENLSPICLLPYEPRFLLPLLGKSSCRRCGKCCLPNPKIPEHPGVRVFDNDIRNLSCYSGYSVQTITKKTWTNKDPQWSKGRYLTLPCMFYDKKAKKCLVYGGRPLVCRTYPISNTPTNNITVNLNCDYGKEIYLSIFKLEREAALQCIMEKVERTPEAVAIRILRILENLT